MFKSINSKLVRRVNNIDKGTKEISIITDIVLKYLNSKIKIKNKPQIAFSGISRVVIIRSDNKIISNEILMVKSGLEDYLKENKIKIEKIIVR